ncbi:hypothetical protein SDC9_116203 [bioreactor metagenome]|uniref:Uncharacterized protein n=1 Tax=bioreactor metagenome TaxID=1076179 RepID=A0A645BV03_9ZZZZ
MEPAALAHKLGHVDFAYGHLTRERRALSEQNAVFRDQVMAGKDHIGCRFAFACVAVDIPAYESRALARYELAAEFVLADGFIACREVCNDECARDGVADARRVGYPQILADLGSEHEAFHRAVFKEKLCTERHALAKQGDMQRFSRSCCEVALFVKFVVIGKVGFRYEPQKFSAVHNGCTVVEHAAQRDRQADDGDHIA